MVKADHLIEKIRIEHKPLAGRILHHRYLEVVETGSMAPEKLRIFAGQQCHIITSDLRSIALLLSRHGNLPSRPYLLGLLQGENAALEKLSKFGHALGMSDVEIRAAEPLPGAFAYSAFVAWLGAFGSDAELAGAFAVNLTAWGANCRRMSGALKGRHGFKPDAVAFFDLFANPPSNHDTGLAVVQDGLDRGIEPALVERAARLLQEYELMYWDSIADATGV
jgi:pyrroloquinoline quinone (PQQ) biosynthesis protein C